MEQKLHAAVHVYIGTHLMVTSLLLWPLSGLKTFWFKNANTAGFLWPAGDWIRVPLKCITLQSLSNGHPQGNG